MTMAPINRFGHVVTHGELSIDIVCFLSVRAAEYGMKHNRITTIKVQPGIGCVSLLKEWARVKDYGFFEVAMDRQIGIPNENIPLIRAVMEEKPLTIVLFNDVNLNEVTPEQFAGLDELQCSNIQVILKSWSDEWWVSDNKQTG